MGPAREDPGQLGAAVRAVARCTLTLRVAFGVVWAIDAYLKWQPSFADRFMSRTASGPSGARDPFPTWKRMSATRSSG
jgi:hypothetical protein